jgi:hypothetical protein
VSGEQKLVLSHGQINIQFVILTAIRQNSYLVIFNFYRPPNSPKNACLQVQAFFLLLVDKIAYIGEQNVNITSSKV